MRGLRRRKGRKRGACGQEPAAADWGWLAGRAGGGSTTPRGVGWQKPALPGVLSCAHTRLLHPFPPTPACRFAGINACVESGRIREAQQLLAAMRGANMRPGHGAFNMLMKYHTRRGDMDAARRVFMDFKVGGFRGWGGLRVQGFGPHALCCALLCVSWV